MTGEPQNFFDGALQIAAAATGGDKKALEQPIKDTLGRVLPSMRNSGCHMSGGARCVEAEVAMVLPAPAKILDVRYFHKAGDNRDIWARYPPDMDLRWMAVRQASWKLDGDFQVVAATCSNWSHNLAMTCAIGVLYTLPEAK